MSCLKETTMKYISWYNERTLEFCVSDTSSSMCKWYPGVALGESILGVTPGYIRVAPKPES